MSTGFLEGYLSRAQIRSYMEFIEENGTDAIVEIKDGKYTEEGNLAEMIAGAISSVKEFHLQRFFYKKIPAQLKQLSCVLVGDDLKPQMPEEAAVVGIFYMSRLGKNFTAIEGYKGDVGDVLALDREGYDEYRFDTTETGTNSRLVVFWG